DSEDDVDVARLPNPHAIAVLERSGLDLFVVDERAEARLSIVQNVVPALEDDLRVYARHVSAREPQVGLAAPADREHRLVNRDNAPAECIGHDQTWIHP